MKQSTESQATSVRSRPAVLTSGALPGNCFLDRVVLFCVNADGQLDGVADAPLRTVAERSLQSYDAEIETFNGVSSSLVAIAIPVLRDGAVVSIVVLVGRDDADATDPAIGVFEVWRPVGVYDEVALAVGHYGTMERFQCVSSFVRFEKGSGLPGQVWQSRCGVIHDDLSNHPGFLRAAGASADLLQTAIGIPIAAEGFRSSVVLISSVKSPIARGMEVWKACADSSEFELSSAAYYELGDAYVLPIGSKVSSDVLPFAEIIEKRGPIVFSDPAELLLGRSPDQATPGPTSGLAIPFFDGQTITSITLLHF